MRTPGNLCRIRPLAPAPSGFAILRCATNVDDRRNDDAQFAANARGCKDNGIPFGVYLYSYAGSVEAANSEADHALRMLREAGVSPGDMAFPVFYDLEESRYADARYRPLLASMANTFCSRMESAGYTAGVYANRWWWQTFLTDPVFDRWERWVADWGQSGTDAHLALGKPYAIWQCMDMGWVDGIGVCDIDFDYKSRPYNNPEIPVVDIAPGSVYRMYNRSTGEHLLTADLNEAVTLWSGGWRYEGRPWMQSTDAADVPVYRLFNPATGEHLYTVDRNERSVLATIGWQEEGEKLVGADETGLPVYRLRNPHADGPSSHLYTTDANERAVLLSLGYEDEGISWYGLT